MGDSMTFMLWGLQYKIPFPLFPYVIFCRTHISLLVNCGFSCVFWKPMNADVARMFRATMMAYEKTAPVYYTSQSILIATVWVP